MLIKGIKRHKKATKIKQEQSQVKNICNYITKHVKIKYSACFEDKTELCQLTLGCAVCKVQWFGVYLVYTPHWQAIQSEG